jgi:hypothetical protein
MTDKTAKKPHAGTMERFNLDSHECRTPDDLAMLLRDASSHVMWINQLLTAGMRDALYYDEARVKPYMTLSQTEALMREDMHGAAMIPGEESRAVAKAFTHEQLAGLVAATSALFAASRAARVAARELNANADYLTRPPD